MTIEMNKTIVRRFYEEAVSTGNVSLLEELISPEYVEVFDGVMQELGIEGAMAHINGVRETYADLKIEIEHQIGEGEWVASCITAKGTHVGEWIGIKPTGKEVTFTGVNVDRVVDGRIVEHGGAW